MNRANPHNTISLAGWLFADLLLGLSMIFLLSSPPPPPLPATPTPTRTPTFTATFTPNPTSMPSPMMPTGQAGGSILTPSPTPLPTDYAPVGLAEPQCYNLELEGTDPTDGSERTAILQQLKNQLPNDPSFRAGLLLIWGHGKDIYDGRRIAIRVGNVIQQAFPLSFSDASRKSMGFDVGAYKHVQVEVYFFTDSEWKGGNPVKCEFTD
ncbi:MAG: hypothetical protein WHV66_02210 [Anaerolineales bacterium]